MGPGPGRPLGLRISGSVCSGTASFRPVALRSVCSRHCQLHACGSQVLTLSHRRSFKERVLFPPGTCKHSGKVLISPGFSRLSSNANDSTACIYSRAGCSSLVPGPGQGQGSVSAGTAAGCGHCQFQPQSWLGSVLIPPRPQFPDREPGFSGRLVICASHQYTGPCTT